MSQHRCRLEARTGSWTIAWARDRCWGPPNRAATTSVTATQVVTTSAAATRGKNNKPNEHATISRERSPVRLKVTTARRDAPEAPHHRRRPTHHERVVRWSPDGQSLAFIDGVGGAANIWLEGIDHQSRQKLTHFTDGMISSFDWSRDGLKLAWMRVQEVRDVVAIALKGPDS